MHGYRKFQYICQGFTLLDEQADQVSSTYG